MFIGHQPMLDELITETATVRQPLCKHATIPEPPIATYARNNGVIIGSGVFYTDSANSDIMQQYGTVGSGVFYAAHAKVTYGANKILEHRVPAALTQHEQQTTGQ
jgi:hypothetical protein